MYCWNCGNKNSDSNKFCGECGKMQVRPPVIVEEDLISDNIKTMNPPAQRRIADSRAHDARVPESKDRVSSTPDRGVTAPDDSLTAKSGAHRDQKDVPVAQKTPLSPPPGTGITPTRLASTNPLVEEPRAVRDSPLASTIASSSPSVRPSQPSMRISGPSFLGLSDAPTTSDYLLDDEVESSSTARNYIALGLLLLFGVLVYKQWDSVSAIGKDLAQRAGASNTASSSKSKDSPATPNPATSNPATANNEVAENRTPAADQKPESDRLDAQTNDAQAKDAQAKAEAENSDATEEDATKRETAPAEPKPDSANSKKSAAPPPTTEAEAAVPAVYDDSQIDLAQKYLQGRGVAQDCGRGISLLRSAAAKPNPKAQIKLGALYATGYCVSQDKAEAYRWFAEAHQLQPGNQWIDKNLNSLWSEMTSEERARVQR